VARRDNLKVIETLRSIEHLPTRAEVDAERELVRILEETSKVPVGGLATVRGDQIQVKACVLSIDGKERLFAARSGNAAESVRLAREIGEELIAKGAGRIGESWRNPRH
jgi:hydroxymethylbilane synthase